MSVLHEYDSERNALKKFYEFFLYVIPEIFIELNSFYGKILMSINNKIAPRHFA